LYEEVVGKNYTQADIYYKLGNAYYLANEIDKAISNYALALKEKNNICNDAYYNLGNALCLKKRYKEAINSYKLAVRFNKENGEIYFNMANCYYVTKDYKLAASSYEEAILNDFNSDEVKYALIRTLIEIPENEYIQKCEDILKEVIEKEPENIDFLYYFALSKHKLNQKSEAILNLKVKICLPLENIKNRPESQRYN
jgi:tetratricopeptide (TPR) repeat protein